MKHVFSLFLSPFLFLSVFICLTSSGLIAQKPALLEIKAESIQKKIIHKEETFLFLAEDLEENTEIEAAINDELTKVIEPGSIEKRELAVEFAQSKKKQDAAERAEEDAKRALKSANSSLLKSYAAEKIKLSAYKSHLAELHQEWILRIQSLLETYTDLEKELLDLEEKSLSLEQLTNDQLSAVFTQSQVLWRKILDDGSSIYKLASKILKVEEVPELPADLLKKVSAEKRVAFDLLHQSTQKDREEFVASQSQSFAEKFENYYAIFAKSARLRSVFLGEMNARQMSIFSNSISLSSDLFREVFAIPFRIFGVIFLRLFHVKTGFSAGFWELLQTVFNLFWLFFWFLIPFTLRFTNRYILKYIDRYRKYLLYHSSGNIMQRLKRASLLKQLTPYIPWAIYCFLLYWVYQKLEGAGYDEARVILPLIIYFTMYRVSRLLMRDSLGWMREFLSLKAADYQERIRKTSRNLGLFFFVIACILYISKAAVDEGYLYELLKSTMRYLGYLILAKAAYNWRQEISATAESVLHERVAPFLAKYCVSYLGIFLCLPVILIILVTVALRYILRFLSRFEFIKRLMAKFYRRQIESLGEVSQIKRIPVPDEYKELFAPKLDVAEKFVIQANKKVFEQMKKEINAWLSDEEADPALLLYGEKGLGKSMMLRRLATANFDCKVIKITIPAKITREKSLYAYLAKAFGFDNDAPFLEQLNTYNENSEQKTLVLLDDAENLYIGKMGGFKAVKAFIKVLNQNNENIFWCSTFNAYAWTYLRGVLGGAQYLGTELALRAWSDTNIRALIEIRQSDNQYDVSYERIIRVTGQGGDLQGATFYAKEQYFRMLWEQSNGNPRIALYLWRRSVSLKNAKQPKKLLVHLPEKPRSGQLSKLSELSWFILAAIVKHENATRAELEDATNITLSEILHLLKIGVEQRILFHGEDDRYRINFLYHFEVIKHLKSKNLIFGRD